MVGFILKKIVKERVLFEIKSRGGGALYGIEERGRGFWQSCHPPSSSMGNRGGGPRASAAAGVRAKGSRGCGGLIPPPGST